MSRKKSQIGEKGYYLSVKSKCSRLGVWRDEFEVMARRLAKIYVRIADIEKRMSEDDFSPVVEHTNKGGATNIVKNPLISQLDTLYDQAVTCERELGLTPAALKRLKDAVAAPRASKFDDIIESVVRD